MQPGFDLYGFAVGHLIDLSLTKISLLRVLCPSVRNSGILSANSGKEENVNKKASLPFSIFFLTGQPWNGIGGYLPIFTGVTTYLYVAPWANSAM